MHQGGMKPLPVLFIVCLVASSLFLLFALFLRPTKNNAVVTVRNQSFPADVSFVPADSRKTTDKRKTSLVALQDADRIFEKVEVEASMDTAVWRNHLQRRLAPFFDSAAANIPVGSYRVDVRFVVGTDGQISSATAINDPGYGLAKASEDAVRKSPKWTPGRISECFVFSWHTQPIIFIVTPEEYDADTVKETVNPSFPHPTASPKRGADTVIASAPFL